MEDFKNIMKELEGFKLDLITDRYIFYVNPLKVNQTSIKMFDIHLNLIKTNFCAYFRFCEELEAIYKDIAKVMYISQECLFQYMRMVIGGKFEDDAEY